MVNFMAKMTIELRGAQAVCEVMQKYEYLFQREFDRFVFFVWHVQAIKLIDQPTIHHKPIVDEQDL